MDKRETETDITNRERRKIDRTEYVHLDAAPEHSPPALAIPATTTTTTAAATTVTVCVGRWKGLLEAVGWVVVAGDNAYVVAQALERDGHIHHQPLCAADAQV